MKKEAATTELAVAREKVKGMQAMIDASPVTNDEELGGVADKIKNVKMLLKFIEEKKEKFTEPAKAIIAEAKETYDPLIKECRNAEIVLKDRAGKYMLAKEKKQEKDQKKIADRVERGTMKTETAVKKLEAMPEVPNTVRTNQGSALRMAKRKVAKITDPSLIPDEFWVIDEVRVRREALEREKNNLPQIPGVVISEEANLSSI